jgi:lysophospholipase L1-like esterase
MVDLTRADGRHRGWADRVAEQLARIEAADGGSVEYANLAIRGRLLDAVVREQFGPALGMAPDIITFHAGANDVLRPGTDLDGLVRRYSSAVGRLATTGARLVLFTSLARAGGSGRFADRLEARFTVFNDGVRSTAAAHDCVLVDLHDVTALTDRRFWGVDRLHLEPEGHARVAAAVLAALGVDDTDALGGAPDWWRVPLPAPAPTGRVDALAADARWVGEHFLPWVGRRVRGVSSGDGLAPKDPVPRLVPAPSRDQRAGRGRGRSRGAQRD